MKDFNYKEEEKRLNKYDTKAEEYSNKHYKLLRQLTKDRNNLSSAKAKLKKAMEPEIRYVSHLEGFDDEQKKHRIPRKILKDLYKECRDPNDFTHWRFIDILQEGVRSYMHYS